MSQGKRFENLEVWKKGCRLVVAVYRVTKSGEFGRDFALRDQIRRAAISIPSNIAEGYERNSPGSFRNSLQIAKGSAGEVRTQLYIAGKLEYLMRRQLKDLLSASEEVSRMLAGYIARLK